jgi:hypothetical protein
VCVYVWSCPVPPCPACPQLPAANSMCVFKRKCACMNVKEKGVSVRKGEEHMTV